MSRAASNRAFIVAVVCVSVTVVVFFSLVDPISQDPNYHDFADTRTLLGVSNFFNVASNVGFLLVGVWGLAISKDFKGNLVLPCIVFFSGLFLTAFGSGWYHLAPANAPLVWDRLPMTIGFAGLVGIIWEIWGGPGKSSRLTWAYAALGVGSVLYWSWSETQGAGDLRPYAVAAFLPMLVVPVLLILRPKPWLGPYLWVLIGLYICAKLFEHFDAVVYETLGISGHSLKHVFAAAAAAAIAVGLQCRSKSLNGFAK